MSENIIKYKCLPTNEFNFGKFSLKSIRFEDRNLVLKWRNEQVFHLRQSEKLTVEEQDHYFINVVSKLYEVDRPNQLLFSFFENDEMVAYGGLVHINWIDQHAEVSFLINTDLQSHNFEYYWTSYLKIISEIAFEHLKFHKIFTYAFDLRPQLYPILIKAGFIFEARLKEHCYFESKFIDVLIHSKYATTI